MQLSAPFRDVFPETHVVQAVAAAADQVPARQMLHDVDLVKLVNLPAEQSVHDGAEPDENLPLAQSEQTDCPVVEKVPAAHAMQDALATAELYEPAAQGAQACWQVAKVVQVGLKVPTEQSEHVEAPANTACFPAAQMSHVKEPAIGWNLPATQDVQTEIPVDGAE